MVSTTTVRSARVPRAASKSATQSVASGAVLGGVVGLALSTFLVMLLIGAIHSSVPAVPAVGFWTTLAGVVATRIAVNA